MYNVTKWIEENSKYFLPPVCNKLMHQAGHMKMMFVGGPNQRKDYHIELGEELFYQVKGDMILKVVEQGRHRDVHIKEGQIFLLPARIQHSPQRFANTVGMVMERERAEEEKDGLRYFVEKDGKPTTESLFEAWFHCEDLGTQLAPIIKEYFASEQYKTGKPVPGAISENPPITVDQETKLQDPMDLEPLLDACSEEIRTKGRVALYDCDKFQFQVYVFGKGDIKESSPVAETYIWQLRGESCVSMGSTEYKLAKDDSLLVPVNTTYVVSQDESSMCLVAWQDHTKA